MEKNFTIQDENGQLVNCRALFAFVGQQDNKNYIIFTKETEDLEATSYEIGAMTFTENEDGTLNYSPLEDDRQWLLVEGVLDLLQQGELQPMS